MTALQVLVVSCSDLDIDGRYALQEGETLDDAVLVRGRHLVDGRVGGRRDLKSNKGSQETLTYFFIYI